MPFSLLIFAQVLVIAAATIAATVLLSLKWTRYRRLYQLLDWCKSRGLRMVRKSRGFPPLPPLLQRVEPALRVRWLIRDDDAEPSDDQITLLRAQTPTQTYNLLLVRMPHGGAWPATALRPTVRRETLIDRLNLFSYPSTMGIDRFTLHGEHPGAARKLNESHARGLLPRDIGAVVADDLLILDFSDRPFDQLEFDRMILLGKQVAAALPPSQRGGQRAA